MGTIKRFEDIEAWQKARELVKDIYDLTSKGNFARDYSLRDQIRRAAVSVMLNIAEGFGRKTDKEFARFLVQSHGSAAEVQSVLYIAIDQKYISRDKFDYLYNKAGEISKMINALSQYLSKRQ
ncbi:MAG: four helix bundle protein [Planctomycetota bacterium]